MRAVNRLLQKVYFHRTDDTPCVWNIAPGLERITWNTDPEQYVTGHETQPCLELPKRRQSQPLEVFYLR